MIDIEFCGGDFPLDDYLMHYGVKGMKWGVRRAEKLANKLQRKGAEVHTYKDGTKRVSRGNRGVLYDKSGTPRTYNQKKLSKIDIRKTTDAEFDAHSTDTQFSKYRDVGKDKSKRWDTYVGKTYRGEKFARDNLGEDGRAASKSAYEKRLRKAFESAGSDPYREMDILARHTKALKNKQRVDRMLGVYGTVTLVALGVNAARRR